MADSASTRRWSSSGMAAHPTFRPVEGDRRRHRPVQRLRAARAERDVRYGVGRVEHLRRQALSLGTEAEDHRPVAQPDLPERFPASGVEREPAPGQVLEGRPRGWPGEDRAHAGPHRLRRERVGAAWAEHHRGVCEGVRRADDRSHVSRVLNPVQVHEHVAGGIRPTALVHADHPRPGAKGADVSEQVQLLAPALLLELPDRLELLVVGGSDHGTKKGASAGARENAVPWFARLRSHGLPGPVGKASEGLRVAHGDVGQHLAVDLDTGLLQAVHELAVRHALLASGGVDADDPQPPEVALAVTAVAIGVGVGLEQGLLGALVALGGLTAVALGPLESGAALLARVDRSLDATHLCNSSVTRLRSAFATSAGRPRRRMRFELFLPVKWLVKEGRARSFPLAVWRNRFLEPE